MSPGNRADPMMRRCNVHGLALLPVVGGVGVLIAVLSAAITVSTVLMARQAAASLWAIEDRGAEDGTVAAMVTDVAEAVGARRTLMAEDFESWSEKCSQLWHRQIRIEDESAKLNLNRMPHLLSRWLAAVGGGLSAGNINEIARRMHEYVGLALGKGRDGLMYAWKPDHPLGLRVTPANPAGHGPEHRHIYWQRVAERSKWLEDPEELIELLSDIVPWDVVKQVVEGSTTVPTYGLNVNTLPAPYTLLQVAMDWQVNASAGDERVVQYYDQFMSHVPPPASVGVFMGPGWDQGVHLQDRVYKDRGFSPSEWKTSSMVSPRFRGARVTDKRLIMEGHKVFPFLGRRHWNTRVPQPYQADELVQQVGTHMFLYPFFDWMSWWNTLQAVHVVMQGPGMFTDSSEFIGMKFEGRNKDITQLILRIDRRGGYWVARRKHWQGL